MTAGALALALLLTGAFFWWRSARLATLDYRPSAEAAAGDVTVYHHPLGAFGGTVPADLLVPIGLTGAPVRARAYAAIAALLGSAPETGLTSSLDRSWSLKKVAFRDDFGVIDLEGRDLTAPAVAQLGETLRDAVPGLNRYVITRDGRPWGAAPADLGGQRLYLPVRSGSRVYLARKRVEDVGGDTPLRRGQAIIAALATQREAADGMGAAQTSVLELLPKPGEAELTAWHGAVATVTLSPEYLARVTGAANRALVLDVLAFNVAGGGAVQTVTFEARGSRSLNQIWPGSPASLSFPRRPNPRDGAKASAEEKAAVQGTARAASLLVVGDISLARRVDTLIHEHGVAWPLQPTAAILESGDITVANLEAALSDRGAPLPNKEIWLRGRPSSGPALTGAGIDAVNLANNHILDYDTESLLQTFDVLQQNGVVHFGAGEDLGRARRPAFIEAKGLRVALLGYNEFAPLYFSLDYPRSFEATATQSGTPPLRQAMVEADVREAKKVSDAVVVYLHWGVEGSDFPLPTQRTMAHGFIDAGADLVAGTHPHVLQGIELYRGRPILYSLGNYVYDQRQPKQVETLIFMVTLTPGGLTDPLVVPVTIVDAQPRPAGEAAAAAQLKRLDDLSKPLGAAIGDATPSQGYFYAPVRARR